MREFDPPTSTDTRKSSTDTRRSTTGIREVLPRVHGIDPQENPENPDNPYLTGDGFAAARANKTSRNIENGEAITDGIADSRRHEIDEEHRRAEIARLHEVHRGS